MALKISPCVRCGASPLQMTLKEGEGWICSSHNPPPPEDTCMNWYPFTDGYDACELKKGHEGRHVCNVDNGYYRTTLTWERYKE